jgi:hypothetical protein
MLWSVQINTLNSGTNRVPAPAGEGVGRGFLKMVIVVKVSLEDKQHSRRVSIMIKHSVNSEKHVTMRAWCKLQQRRIRKDMCLLRVPCGPKTLSAVNRWPHKVRMLEICVLEKSGKSH